MLISLFNGLKGAMNITKVIDPETIENTNNELEKTPKSALSAVWDVLTGEDAHEVQKELDASQEKDKEKHDRDSEKEEEKLITAPVSAMGAVLMGKDARDAQQELDETKERETEPEQPKTKSSLLKTLQSSSKQTVQSDDQISKDMWQHQSVYE